eukprot:TRINITY_DN17211_c0_g1_i1.p1 TRINITY_DN17211_c0_g1~~TRINITY_DN17211_c0_g1_i1.p1  ORF type:complete len:812 (+),score=266.83 TRINITY_DN17211_c0_g1_i1:195-2438(+)
MDIADRTNKLVLIAQQVATSSTDVDLQMEVANAINDIASSIERLVVSFTALLGSSNPQTQQAFAGAAKDVGEAINRLCAATDSTSQQKITIAVNDARQSAQEVMEAASISRERLLQAAQNNVDKTVRLVKVATTAATSTSDETKKRLLNEGSARVKSGGPSLIQAAKGVSERGGDSSAKSEMSNRYRELESAFNQLLEAARMSPGKFGKLVETYEYVRRLIEAAKDLEATATDLYNIVMNRGSDADFLNAARETGRKALQLAEQAEAAARKEKDPIKRVLLQDMAAQLRDASAAYLRAAKAYRQNPNDPALRRAFEEAHEALNAAIRRVANANQSGSLGDETTPEGRFLQSASALEVAARNVLNGGLNGSPTLVEDAQTLAAVAMRTAQDIEALAAQCSDPAQKARLLKQAQDIRDLSQKMIAAAKRLAMNPNDEQAKRDLQQAYDQLMGKLDEARREARGENNNRLSSSPSYEASSYASGKGANSDEMQLINAAKEEANAALLLAAEAEKLAAKITDPRKREAIKKAIQEVKECSRRVIEAADLLAKNPHDLAAQQKLSAAQKDLSAAIQKVVSLTGGDNPDDELSGAMADMKLADQGGAEGLLLTRANELLQKIGNTFGNPNNKMTPEQVIAAAKELSTDANDLARQLRELAAKTSDPVFKEKLLNMAKILRDGGLQIKILSAVRAAGGEDKSNSLQYAAKGLQNNITEIIKEVQAEQLRSKFRNTVKQTIAINRVVSVWKAKAK